MTQTIKHDRRGRTFDCEPTLTDSQVAEFCREGHLLLPGVVPDEINERTCDYLEGKIPLQTLQAHVDYGFYEAVTTYGSIGVKCWIYLGPYSQEEDSHGSDAKKG